MFPLATLLSHLGELNYRRNHYDTAESLIRQVGLIALAFIYYTAVDSVTPLRRAWN
jgi:hypothetical protein